MALKYEVGDQVKIKSLDWYNENKDEYGVVLVENGEYMFRESDTEWCSKIVTIRSIHLSEYYLIEEDDGKYRWTDEMIQGLVEEEIKLEPKFKVGDIVYSRTWQRNVVIHEILPDCVYKVGDLFSTNWFKAHEDNLRKENIKPTTEYNLPDGYELKDENGNVINATKIVLEKKKKEYPKTYAECLKVLGFNVTRKVKETLVFDYDDDIIALQKLKRCRDAYWKIAGEDMGLGKPWEPSRNEECFTIFRSCGKVCLYNGTGQCEPFEFPTAEMRDAFKENFDKDLEFCKELL